MCEQKYKFFKPEPRLYEFELSEELEKKWKYGIKNSIPMFLTSLTPYVNTNIVVCELEQNDKLEKGLYYFQLSKYPKNIEEMKIARYFFQLLFNCSFTFFDIHLAIINPQMLELLFVDEIARNVLLQIHTQETDLMFYDDHPLNIVRNHLVANEFNIEFGKRFDFDVEKKADVVLEILANGGDKFSNIYLEYLHSKLYNLIIEVCKTYYRAKLGIILTWIRYMLIWRYDN
ncbi:unnamed protein product [Meloidogyne enterolobii]|uniref:Uncharacterized protein n=1 Tax=Meloidogyne enterolobii TaxID=390850 RepID=A0ACB0ZZ89_MELEN